MIILIYTDLIGNYPYYGNCLLGLLSQEDVKMANFNISINGIKVVPKDNRYLLQKDGIKMYCGFGELNKSIPEFEKQLKKEKRTLQTV